MTDTPQTLPEAVRYFSDRETCEAYMRKIRWPSGTAKVRTAATSARNAIRAVLAAENAPPIAVVKIERKIPAPTK